MATVQIKIKTIGDTDVTIDKIKNGSPAKITNGSIKTDSNGYYLETSGSGTFNTGNSDSTFVGQEMFTFTGGGLKFSSDGMLVNADGHSAVLVDEQYGNEFVWGVVPTSKAYTVQMSVVLTELKLTALTFAGDAIAGQFPTKIVVDGEEYANDEVDITLPISGTKKEVVVQFTEWNRANYSAVLTKVAIMADEITLGNSDIKTLESQSQSTSQPTDIYYGSVPSSGSANIYDKNGDFYDHIRNGVLPNSNVPIELFVNGKRVQGHISTDSNYDINGRTFSLDFENKLSLYEKVMYEGHDYSEETDNLYGLFKSFCKSVGISSDKMEIMLSNQIVYGTPSKLGTVADYFRAITVPYPYIERGTIRETLDKFCQLTQLNLIENDNGDLVFVQSRPVRAGNEQVLVIPTHCQMSAIDTDIVIDNIIDKAVVAQKSVTVESANKTDVSSLTFLTDLESTIWSAQSSPYNRRDWISQITVSPNAYQSAGEYIKTALYVGTLRDTIVADFEIKAGQDKKRILDVFDKTNITYKLTYVKSVGDARWSCLSSGTDADGYTALPIVTYQENYLSPINDNIRFDVDKREILEDTGTFATSQITQNVAVYSKNYATIGVEQSQTMTNSSNIFSLSFEYDSDKDSFVMSGDEILPRLKLTWGKMFVRMYAVLKNSTQPTINFYGNTNNPDASERYKYLMSLKDGEATSTYGFEIYIPIKLEISILGNTQTITFNDVDTSADESGEHTVSIGGNEMLQTATTLVVDGTSTDLATQISKNITSDYKNGIETMRLTVCCADYKDTYGVVRKNWSKGEIFEVGDIVRVDKDNNGTPAVTYKNGNAKLWKVTGRTFRNEGVPLVDLELQEII